MEPTVPNVLGGLILAGILWLAKSINDHGKDLTQIRTILTGANGENGLNGEVKALRSRSHTLGDGLHALEGKHALLEQRVGHLEEKPA